MKLVKHAKQNQSRVPDKKLVSHIIFNQVMLDFKIGSLKGKSFIGSSSCVSPLDYKSHIYNTDSYYK